jgi:hypothetical protein
MTAELDEVRFNMAIRKFLKHVNDFRVASEQQPVHLDHRLLGISPRTVRELHRSVKLRTWCVAER